jgi:beta-galactosidase GanA
MFAKCHFGNSYYDTKVGHKHLALSGDFLREVLDRAHASDIKIIAYYSLGTDEWILKRNPDWYQVDEAGAIRDGNGTVWHRPCINSPYREELVLPQVREIVSGYDVDGLFLDIPYIQNHRCFCRYCKRKFKESLAESLNQHFSRQSLILSAFSHGIRLYAASRKLETSQSPLGQISR